MVQRSDQRTRSSEFDDDLGDIDDLSGLDSSAESDSGGYLPSFGSSKFFDVRTFLIAFVLSGAAVLGGNTVIPFLGGLAGLLGVFVVGFALGLVGKNHNYVEVGLAGAMASGAAVVLGNLVLTTLGIGLPLAALGVGSGLVAALIGHYFGLDLRDGLTQSI